MAERIVYLGMPLHPAVLQLMVAQLLFLNQDNPTKPISMYVNSAGSVDRGFHPASHAEGFAAVDLMRYISAPVKTVCVGRAYGAAALILAAGKRGHRFALPNSRILIRAPAASMDLAPAADVAVLARETVVIRNRITALFAELTGRKASEFEKIMERNKYLTPEEAVAVGIVDKVLEE